jgi:hypothetical protein
MDSDRRKFSMTEPTLAQVTELIGLIYQAACNPAQWNPAMRTIRKFVANPTVRPTNDSVYRMATSAFTGSPHESIIDEAASADVGQRPNPRTCEYNDVEIFTLLVPHFERASQISRQTKLGNALKSTFSRLSFGTILPRPALQPITHCSRSITGFWWPSPQFFDH